MEYHGSERLLITEIVYWQSQGRSRTPRKVKEFSQFEQQDCTLYNTMYRIDKISGSQY